MEETLEILQDNLGQALIDTARCREFQNGIGTGRDCFYTACKKGLG